MSLPTVETARARMLEGIRALPGEDVSVAEADGRWLARSVTAVRDQPPFDASAMDGWAVRRADARAGVRLRIVGESAAGHDPGCRVGPDEAARISTGGALPPGADRVVVQEDAMREGDEVRIVEPPSPSRHVRSRACDFASGSVLLETGVRLNPWRLALAASAGQALLHCARRPRVAVLSTGDELVEPGGLAGPHQIYNSTAPALNAFVRRLGGQATPLPSVIDDERAILAAVAAVDFDILVTVGGASVGDHDRVKPALRSAGAELTVEGVAVRPGRPTWFGRLAGGRPVLGLPGNPASALVCAELFLGPLLAALQGGVWEDRRGLAVLAADLPVNGPRDHYLRAQAWMADGVQRVLPFADQDSSLVHVMAAATVLVRRPPFAPACAAGTAVETLGPSF